MDRSCKLESVVLEGTWLLMWLHYRSIFTQYSQEYVYDVIVLMHSIECNYETIECYGNLCGKIPEYSL